MTQPIPYRRATLRLALASALAPLMTACGGSGGADATSTPPQGAPAAGLSYLTGSQGGLATLDGAGTAARFQWIRLFSEADSAGNHYLATAYGNGAGCAIRKMSASGEVSTVIATEYGFADGDKASARLGSPLGLTVAADGALYLLDSSDTIRLRRIAGNGSVSTLLANLAPEDARSIVADGGGRLYLLGDLTIDTVGAAGQRTRLAGATASEGFADGVGAAARFRGLTAGAAAPGGGLLLVDGAVLRKVSTAGAVTTPVRPGAAGTGQPYYFANKVAAAANGDVLALYSFNDEYTVTRIAADGATTVLARGSSAFRIPGLLRHTTPPNFVREGAGGKVLLASDGEIRLLGAGQSTVLAGLEDDSLADIDGPAATARMVDPFLLAADAAGNLYIADYPGQNGMWSARPGLYLRKLTPAGQLSTVLAQPDFAQPTGLAIDAAGTVYIIAAPVKVDKQLVTGGAVYKLGADSKPVLVAGSDPRTDTFVKAPVDGSGAAARFMSMELAGFGKDGALYLYDTPTNQARIVRRVTPEGVVSTVAAMPAEAGAAPDGLRYEIAGYAVYRVAADGSKALVAGAPGVNATVLGALPGSLYAPRAIVPTGARTFALISGGALLKLVLPQ